MGKLPEAPGADSPERRSRRDILKAGAAAAGALWAVQTIIPVSRAFTNGSACDETGCLGTAWGFSQNVLAPSVFPVMPGSPCPGFAGLDVNLNQPGPTSATKPVLASSGVYSACHTFDEGTGTCRDEGSIEDVRIRLWKGLFRDIITGQDALTDVVVEADLLSSFTEVGCDCDVSRGSETRNVRIKEPTSGAYISFSNAPPNYVAMGDFGIYTGFRIYGNVQGCDVPGGGFLTSALLIRLPEEVTSRGFGRDIYVGYSLGKRSGCALCT
jgi:hypothetical protein